MFRLLRQRALRWQLFLAAIDFLLLVACVYCALGLRYWSDPVTQVQFGHALRLRALLVALMVVLGMVSLGLYQNHLRANWRGLFTRQAVGFVLGGSALLVLYYAFPPAYIGRGVLGISLVVGFVAVAAFRVVFLNLIDANLFKRRVLVLGAGTRAAQIAQRMRRRSDCRGFRILGYVQMGDEPVRIPANKLLRPHQPLLAWLQRMQIDEIVVGPDDRRCGLPMTELLECKQSGIAVVELADFFERESGQIRMNLANPSWLVFSDGFDSSPLRRLIKRSFDLAVAMIVLTLTWPLMLAVALAIRIESGAGAPVLYRQERVGERGRTFFLVKFRSMGTDAELDGVARFARPNDDRVTRVGRFIRKARLDELPQLWNVLHGDMSFIGPRPERPQFVDDFNARIRYYPLRHCVKPGLTGWAQLRYAYGASQEDAEEKLKFDLFYVKNHNLMFDLMILIQTVEVVLFGRGAR
ncbi:MAG TPA: TIGR03013 family XrtA/PEP-CTERM system glycosyltransferase [Rhodanobacteraceae bacterium]|nr:TIGR03013 family XrtA/PEP-CTERM system glycosyltransferase [Rhodanobacteraceae bacterium]